MVARSQGARICFPATIPLLRLPIAILPLQRRPRHFPPALPGAPIPRCSACASATQRERENKRKVAGMGSEDGGEEKKITRRNETVPFTLSPGLATIPAEKVNKRHPQSIRDRLQEGATRRMGILSAHPSPNAFVHALLADCNMAPRVLHPLAKISGQ